MAAVNGLFLLVLGLVIWQRLLELKVARRNTRRLLEKGAIEVGQKHYKFIVGMHVLFFIGMVAEAWFRGIHWSWASLIWMVVFVVAQLGRSWVMRAMRERWTTRVLVIPGEHLISEGPFRWIPHPNYFVVAIELFSLPVIFGLYWTAVLFSIANAILLLAVRIPVEREALKLADQTH